VDLLAIYPHAHYLGQDLEATAILPDGSTKPLIHIPQWNLNWQAVYRYAEPVALPKGTTISMRYVYDNSDDNALNPNHPPERVRGGNRSKDEMAHLWLQVLPRKFDSQAGDPRMLLQEALARHNIRNNPEDFAAHYNLASMLQARGETVDAQAEYEAALRIRPEDATANNALGAVLLASGQAGRALLYLQTATQTSPDYFDAHYNLGNALAFADDIRGAAREFAAAARIRPDDADAHANLGSALAELGNFADAKAQFERALEINPAHALARENLLQLQSAMANH
jgi:tetratricopeptide (TPR) repeat protein